MSSPTEPNTRTWRPERHIKWKESGIVTTSRSLGWAGMWHSLEGLARQSDRTLDFRKCYPSFIRDSYQPKCVGLMIRTNGTGLLKLELKAPDETLLWMQHVHVNSVPFRSQRFELPTDKLRSVKLLNWIVELGTVSIDEIALIIQYPEPPVETRTFLKSYAKLARCYDEPTGIVRDRANWPVGDFDSVPGSGLFCLATSAAADLGIVEPEFAKDTLKKSIGQSMRSPRTKESYRTSSRQLFHLHYILLSAPLLPDTNIAYKTIQRLEQERLFPPFGLVENVDADLRQFLPMADSLNASFETISAYHLRQKHTGQPDSIYNAANNCDVVADALDVFYLQSK